MFSISRLPPLSWAVVGLLVSMGLLGMGNGAVFQLVPQRFQKEIGIVTGLVGAAGGIGGFFLPFLLGLSKDHWGSYGSGFTFVACAASTCVFLLAYLQRDWRRTWARKEVEASF